MRTGCDRAEVLQPLGDAAHLRTHFADRAAGHRRLEFGEIADALYVSMPAASEIVDRLVDTGHVSRASDPADRRRVIVSTTTESQRAIDRLVEVEGRPEILQLSGGEPTIHPQFLEIFAYAMSQPIDYVMINTNGIRFARDPALVEAIAQHRERVRA